MPSSSASTRDSWSEPLAPEIFRVSDVGAILQDRPERFYDAYYAQQLQSVDGGVLHAGPADLTPAASALEPATSVMAPAGSAVVGLYSSRRLRADVAFCPLR